MRFEDFLKKQLEDQEFSDLWERSDPFFQAGDLLIRLRADLGLSQEDLAEKSGLKRPYISRVESGEANPTVGTLARILASVKFRLRLEAEPAYYGPLAASVFRVTAPFATSMGFVQLVPLGTGEDIAAYPARHLKLGEPTDLTQISFTAQRQNLSLEAGEEVRVPWREPSPIP